MRFQLFVFATVAVSFLGFAKAQDAYYADESVSSETSPLTESEFTSPTVIVIAGTKNGKCTPEMPMLKPNVAYEIQLQATADKTFVLDSKDLNIHLNAAPGKTVSQAFTPSAAGNFKFTCGDQALSENKRTQGMFMVMEM